MYRYLSNDQYINNKKVFLNSNLEKIDYVSGHIPEGVWATVKTVRDDENGKPVNGIHVLPST